MVDGTHLTLPPGFIDAHVHLTFNAGPDNDDVIRTFVAESDAVLAIRALANAQDALRAGVTTVRDCAGRCTRCATRAPISSRSARPVG